MRKWLVILIVGVFLVGCSDSDQEGKDNPSQGTPSETTDGTSKDKQSEQKDKKKTYQIGETAVITSDLYGFDYEVTVTDFNLTKEVDEVKLEDYWNVGDSGLERFAVVDVKIKNISDDSYIPNEMFSANFARENDRGGVTSEDEFFEVGDKELAPGEELEGHLVYVILLDDSETFTLKYEFMSAEETHFILPNLEK